MSDPGDLLQSFTPGQTLSSSKLSNMKGAGLGEETPVTCLPLKNFPWRVLGVLCGGQRDGRQRRDPIEKKYVHVPARAAPDFLATATPRYMKKANEIL